VSTILDYGPHEVAIHVEEKVIDSYGNPITPPSINVVRVRCTVTPLSATRDVNQAGPIDETYRVITRDAPIGSWSRVIYEGQSFTVDSIKRSDVSYETKHVTFIIRAER
jgi:hypothetical protein